MQRQARGVTVYVFCVMFRAQGTKYAMVLHVSVSLHSSWALINVRVGS